tara:strand:- start:9785 stop:10351 length:567 start_codon:yes stop_codon:yes gene_type:complete
MNRIIKSDLFRFHSSCDHFSLVKRLSKDPCFRFLFFFRKAKSSSKISILGIFYNYLYKRYTIKYGIQIPKTVKLGAGFLMLHQGGIVVNSQTIIGDNCTLMHNVTIGNTKRGSKQGTPIIGNSVYIGPGAVVVGKIKIGNNVLIAPNSYVNIDIPSDSIVLGNPCVIKPDKDATKGYINNVYEMNLSS